MTERPIYSYQRSGGTLSAMHALSAKADNLWFHAHVGWTAR